MSFCKPDKKEKTLDNQLVKSTLMSFYHTFSEKKVFWRSSIGVFWKKSAKTHLKLSKRRLAGRFGSPDGSSKTHWKLFQKGTACSSAMQSAMSNFGWSLGPMWQVMGQNEVNPRSFYDSKRCLHTVAEKILCFHNFTFIIVIHFICFWFLGAKLWSIWTDSNNSAVFLSDSLRHQPECATKDDLAFWKCRKCKEKEGVCQFLHRHADVFL